MSAIHEDAYLSAHRHLKGLVRKYQALDSDSQVETMAMADLAAVRERLPDLRLPGHDSLNHAVCMSLGPTGAGKAKCIFIVIIGMVEGKLEARGVPFEPFED